MHFTHKGDFEMNAQRVTPDQSVQHRVGCGSLNIMFDLYLDAASNTAVAFSAEQFDVVIRAAIQKSGMTLRKSFVDAWKSEQEGPASLFFSLEESHVRIETWPEEKHIQGEVQLCNYSKDNAGAARELAERIIKALNPAITQIFFINRGPGPNVAIRQSVWRNR